MRVVTQALKIHSLFRTVGGQGGASVPDLQWGLVKPTQRSRIHVQKEGGRPWERGRVRLHFTLQRFQTSFTEVLPILPLAAKKRNLNLFPLSGSVVL